MGLAITASPIFNYHINVLTFWKDNSSQKAFQVL